MTLARTRLRPLAAFLDMAGAAFRGPPVARPLSDVFDREAFDADLGAVLGTQARSRAILDGIEATLGTNDNTDMDADVIAGRV